jgi:hypothetical protein
MAPMMGGGGGGGGQEAEHQTWLVEDEDVWGAREGESAPPVIGGSLSCVHRPGAVASRNGD